MYLFTSITVEKQKKMNWNKIHITTFLCVEISVKANTFWILENTSRTTWKATVYHWWCAHHRLGAPGLVCISGLDLEFVCFINSVTLSLPFYFFMPLEYHYFRNDSP